jgi:hypothetical protein
MKMKDKKFIREIVSSDFKHISNPDFTQETLEKIADLEDNKINYSNSGDITFLIPVFIYVTSITLFSLISVIISWTQLEQIDIILHSIEKISGFFVHPVTFSILFSFSLLYFLDLYLKKLNAKITKTDKGWT